MLDAWHAQQAKDRDSLRESESRSKKSAAEGGEGHRLQISTMRMWLPASSAVEAITPSSKPPPFPNRDVAPLEPALDALELEVGWRFVDRKFDYFRPLLIVMRLAMILLDAGVSRSAGLLCLTAPGGHVPHANLRAALNENRVMAEVVVFL